MEWIKSPSKSTIRAEVQMGVDMETGRPKYAKRTFSNVKLNAEVVNIAETLQELMSLQKHVVTSLEQTEHSEFYLS